MSTQFDRPLAGFRFADTFVGDTLQTIALRELGDASRWPELISYNNLVPPFITDTAALAAPGVLITGSTIMVPAPTRVSVETDPESVLGTDAQLGQYGELLTTDGGDFAVVSGGQNLMQALTNRLDTEVGDLMFHPEYGNPARRLIGKVNGPTRGLVGAQVVRAAVALDPRVVRATSASAKVVGDTINIAVEVKTVTGRTVTASTKV